MPEISTYIHTYISVSVCIVVCIYCLTSSIFFKLGELTTDLEAAIAASTCCNCVKTVNNNILSQCKYTAELRV